MLWIEIKYANIIGQKLKNFKIKKNSPYVANYSCSFCGDSEKNKSRGYLLEKKGRIISYCHNCGPPGKSLGNLIKEIDQFIYDDYRIETLKEKWTAPKITSDEVFPIFEKPVFKKKIELGKPLSDKINNAAFDYAVKRKIPPKFYDSLFYFKNINELTGQIEKYKNEKFSNEPVLVIPFFTSDREFSFINCRSISDFPTFRYYVLEVNGIHPKIWGLEFIDWSKPVNVFEGPIDAMCVPNSLALAGVSSDRAIDFLKTKNRINFVYDKDSIYNPQVTKQIKKRIDEGFNVVIFNKSFPGKDINEVICNESMTPDEVSEYVQSRSFNGLNAKIELSFQIKNLFS